MDIIHDVIKGTLPRHAQAALAERLGTMPAVVVSGARQTGKSTGNEILCALSGALEAVLQEGPDERAMAFGAGACCVVPREHEPM